MSSNYQRIPAVFFTLFLLNLVLTESKAQTPGFDVDVFSIEQGLSQSSVEYIYQDRLGLIWFGTEDGLNKYDGYDFTVYKPDPLDPNSISGRTITFIHESRDGILWIGSEGGGISQFDRKTEQFIRHLHDPDLEGSLSSNIALTIEEDSNGNLWIGTALGGLNRFDYETGLFTHFRSNPDDSTSLSSDIIFSIIEGIDGKIWIGTEGGGLNRFDPETEMFTQYLNNFTDPELTDLSVILTICEDYLGILWLGTPLGLVQFDRETGQYKRYAHNPDDPRSLSSDIVYTIHEDDSGRLWIGTVAGGLNLFDRLSQSFLHITHDPTNTNSLPDNTVFSVMEDFEGALWIGTENGGVARLTEKTERFVTLRNNPLNRNSLSDNSVWSMYEDRSGILWIGTEAGGLDRFDRDTGDFLHFEHDPNNPNSIPAGIVQSILEDRSGFVWIGMDGFGLSRLDPETFKFDHYEYQPDNPAAPFCSYVDVLYEDQKGNLWIGSNGDGINRFNSETNLFTRYLNEPDSLWDYDVVFALHEDGSGSLWAGTLNGLMRFDPVTERFTHYPYNPDNLNGLPSPVVTSIYEDPRSDLWLGTNYGLHKFIRPTTESDYQFIRYSEDDGLANDMVYAVMGDESRNLWLSTNRGLVRFNPETETFRIYDVEEGIPGFEFNQGAYHKSRSGELFFGGLNGLVRFYPSHIQDNPFVPPIIITSFKRNDEKLRDVISTGETITIPYTKSYLSFEFAVLDYSSTGKNLYAYQLEGYDDDWIFSGTRRHASYTNIDPGYYTFRVKGSNRDVIWNEEGTFLHVDILPPFWLTRWFRLTVLAVMTVLVVGLVYSWERWRLDRIQKAQNETIEIQRRINDRLEAERLHIARELHDGPVQRLQLTGFQLNLLNESLIDEGDKTKVSTLRETLQKINRDLRSICRELRPPALVHFGLARAIRSHAEYLLELYPTLNIQLNLAADRDLFTERFRLALFRIYQETMNNVVRHAGPCTVTITLKLDESRVILEILDDGVGFDMPEQWRKLAQDNHFGLLGAAERAYGIGGILEIFSQPGAGTAIKVTAPLEYPAISEYSNVVGPQTNLSLKPDVPS